jgi:hypothetical protein
VLPILSLAAPAAHAAVGFTGTFEPETWLVVNTGGSLNQRLNFSGVTPSGGLAIDGKYGCSGSNIPPEGTNVVACISEYTADGVNNQVSLLGSTGGVPPTFDGDPPQEIDPGFEVPGGGLQGSPRSSTLVFTNNYWRPYLVSFDWTFTDAADANAGATDQYVSFLVDPGFISPNTGNTYSYTSETGVAYTNSSSVAYLPPGATLSFSVNTLNNSTDPGVLTIKGFTTEEVPAPLPIAGSSGVLLYSRRLRRRTRKAASQPPALHPTTGKLLSLAEQRSAHQRQRALKHYGSILAGPVQSALSTCPTATNG